MELINHCNVCQALRFGLCKTESNHTNITKSKVLCAEAWVKNGLSILYEKFSVCGFALVRRLTHHWNYPLLNIVLLVP